MENKHQPYDLAQMQSLPLHAKVRMTQQRIKAWYEHWDGDVYVSFSGGKDSTVLLDIVRNVCGYTDVPAVFVDTGLEYPEIREFVKTFDNVVWLKPKKKFKQVIEEYGYPFISKEISGRVYYARRYLKMMLESDEAKITGAAEVMDMLGLERRNGKNKEFRNLLENKQIPYDELEKLFSIDSDANVRGKIMFGNLPHKENGVTTEETSKLYDSRKYKFMVFSPYNFSERCCSVMKKSPVHKYAKETGRKPMTGQQASESRLRKSNWMKYGCNGFDMKEPISNPMAFWTEQDILQYIKQNNLPICSVYGDIVYVDDDGMQYDNDFFSGTMKLQTTGCKRTGCMFCGYGCHLEKGEGRFEKMKKTHPKQYDYIMRPKEQGGLNYKAVIDWLNENGNLNIKY